MRNPPLYRLCYASTATQHFNSLQMGSILESSCRNNISMEITGVLFFSNHYFLQFLEGPRDNLILIYRKISQDQRHTNVELLELKQIESRYFEEWSMKYVSFPHVLDKILREGGLDEFNPYLLDNVALELIAEAFRSHYDPQIIPTLMRRIQRYVVRHGQGSYEKLVGLFFR
jgi:Sensors of blue-light using FAD